MIDQDSSQKLWLIEYAEALHQIGLCMQETREFELAGGFFETAVEKLKAVSEDARRKIKLKKRVRIVRRQSACSVPKNKRN